MFNWSVSRPLFLIGGFFSSLWWVVVFGWEFRFVSFLEPCIFYSEAQLGLVDSSTEDLRLRIHPAGGRWYLDIMLWTTFLCPLRFALRSETTKWPLFSPWGWLSNEFSLMHLVGVFLFFCCVMEWRCRCFSRCPNPGVLDDGRWVRHYLTLGADGCP